MAYTLAQYEVYLPEVLDKVFASTALTNVFGGTVDGVNIIRTPNPKVYNILQMDFGNGLGNYDRNNGFKTGKVTTEFKPLEVKVDRSTSFSIDAVDDENAGNIATRILSEFTRTKTVPEIDAYRFAKLAQGADADNIVSGSLSTDNAVWTAVQDGLNKLFQAHANRYGNYIFVTASVMSHLNNKVMLQRQFNSQQIDTRTTVIDGNTYIEVPDDLFLSGIELADYNDEGVGGGFEKATDAVGLNFLIVTPSVVTTVVAHQRTRFFNPEVNQKADAYKVDYRLVHDLWVRPNGAKGIVVHKQTA